MNSSIQEIKESISMNKFEYGLNLFQKVLTENKYSISRIDYKKIEEELIGILNSYNNLNKQELLGTISIGDYAIETNKMTIVFLRLADQLDFSLSNNDKFSDFIYEAITKSNLKVVRDELIVFFNSEPIKRFKSSLFNSLSQFYIEEIIRPCLISYIEEQLKKESYLNAHSEKEVFILSASKLMKDEFSKSSSPMKRIIVDWIEDSTMSLTSEMKDLYKKYNFNFEDFSLSHYIQITNIYFDYTTSFEKSLPEGISQMMEDVLTVSQKPRWYHIVPSLVGLPVMFIGIAGMLVAPIMTIAGAEFGKRWMRTDVNREVFLINLKREIAKSDLKKLKESVTNSVIQNADIQTFLQRTMNRWFERTYTEQIERIDNLIELLN